MKYLSVPCPHCLGLVQEPILKCVTCGEKWDTILELIYDGLCTIIDRAVQSAALVPWKTLEDAQPFWNLISLHHRYEQALERYERN